MSCGRVRWSELPQTFRSERRVSSQMLNGPPRLLRHFGPLLTRNPHRVRGHSHYAAKEVAEEKQVGRRRAEQRATAAQRAAQLDTLLPEAADTSVCSHEGLPPVEALIALHASCIEDTRTKSTP